MNINKPNYFLLGSPSPKVAVEWQTFTEYSSWYVETDPATVSELWPCCVPDRNTRYCNSLNWVTPGLLLPHKFVRQPYAITKCGILNILNFGWLGLVQYSYRIWYDIFFNCNWVVTRWQ